MLLAYTRYGDAWLRHPDISGEMAPQKQQQEEPLFIDVGRDVLLKRVKKMIDWRDKVLQDDDIEAVHKMRVASRRLRATLDAYEACCKPKQFKKVYREIKDLADRLGAVRDTDVMIVHLQDWIEGMPEAEHEGVYWLMDRLREYRQGQFQAMDAKVRSLDKTSWQQKIMACFSEETEGGLSHG
jgi:CHAD domain-containing protein